MRFQGSPLGLRNKRLDAVTDSTEVKSSLPMQLGPPRCLAGVQGSWLAVRTHTVQQENSAAENCYRTAGHTSVILTAKTTEQNSLMSRVVWQIIISQKRNQGSGTSCDRRSKAIFLT